MSAMRRSIAIDELVDQGIKIEDFAGFVLSQHGVGIAPRLHCDPVAGLNDPVEEEKADCKMFARVDNNGRVVSDPDDLARHRQAHGIAPARARRAIA